jgi:hypothetical protein
VKREEGKREKKSKYFSTLDGDKKKDSTKYCP